jgi:hypothetical protein
MITLLLLACGPDKGTPSAPDVASSVYAGAVGTSFAFIPAGQPDADMLFVAVRDEAWEVRIGLEWDDAAAVGRWARSFGEDGLALDGVVVLPGTVAVGSTSGAATVTADGARTVWYGTFPETVAVEVAEGSLAGEHVFARDIGPIQLTVDGAVWELATYGEAEPEEPADTGDTGSGGDTGDTGGGSDTGDTADTGAR